MRPVMRLKKQIDVTIYSPGRDFASFLHFLRPDFKVKRGHSFYSDILALRENGPYEYGLTFAGGFEFALMLRLSGVKIKMGENTDSRSFLLDRTVETGGPAYESKERLASLLPEDFFDGQIPKFETRPSPYTGPKPYFLVAPRASHPNKEYAIESFVKISDVLRTYGEPVFVSREDNIPVSGRKFWGLSLPHLAALMRGAEFFVGNNSSLMHMAGLFNIPSIVMNGSSSLPLASSMGSNVLYIYRDTPCHPCKPEMMKSCSHVQCLRVPEDLVLKEIVSWLATKETRIYRYA